LDGKTAAQTSNDILSGAELDRLCVNTIRGLAMDAVQKADSGHPGMPMGAAPMAYVLWTRHLRYDPLKPRWPNLTLYPFRRPRLHAALQPAPSDRL